MTENALLSSDDLTYGMERTSESEDLAETVWRKLKTIVKICRLLICKCFLCEKTDFVIDSLFDWKPVQFLKYWFDVLIFWSVCNDACQWVLKCVEVCWDLLARWCQSKVNCSSHVRHCGLVVSAPAWDGTDCEFDSWQCRIYIPCSLSSRLLGSLRGSLGTYGLTQKLCLKSLAQMNMQVMWLQKEEEDDEFDGCLGCGNDKIWTAGIILRNFTNCTKSIRNKVKLSFRKIRGSCISDDTNKSITFHLDPSQFSRHLSRHLFTRFWPSCEAF